jgi:hypothetical protein
MRHLIDLVENLMEVFDSHSDIEWPRPDMAIFRVGDCRYEATFALQDSHQYDFYFVAIDREGYISLSNTGDAGRQAFQVYGFITEILKQFILNANPTMIHFSGDTDAGLAKLYDRMAKYLSPRLHEIGYDVDISVNPNDVCSQFYIRKAKTLTESVEEIDGYRFFKNPTREQTLSLLQSHYELRGICYRDGVFLFYEDIIHAKAISILGINAPFIGQDCFYITNSNDQYFAHNTFQYLQEIPGTENSVACLRGSWENISRNAWIKKMTNT